MPYLPCSHHQTALALALVQTFRQRFPALNQPRASHTHKGTFGTVAVVGGQTGMVGAVSLAATAALLMGCGKSYAVFCQQTLPFAMMPQFPEIMLSTVDEIDAIQSIDVLAIGCGMGVNDVGRLAIERVISVAAHRQISVIIDADALNLLATEADLVEQVQQCRRLKVLTPHPGEAARLLNTDIATIQRNRLAHAHTIASRFDAWVILKGNNTVIVSPNGESVINDTGNAGLATAGSGDVLTGMLMGLLASTTDIKQAICGAVWLHGAAAQWLGDNRPLAGLLAGEIAPAARLLRHVATV